MRLRIEIDDETRDRLVESALDERRPVVWQAEILLRRALGLEPGTRSEREQREVQHASAR